MLKLIKSLATNWEDYEESTWLRLVIYGPSVDRQWIENAKKKQNQRKPHSVTGIRGQKIF